MASCRQSRLVVTCQPGSLNYLTSSGRLELVPPYSPFFFACRTELIAWNVLYRRDAQLRLAACHEIRQRVRAATHSPIGASESRLPRHVWHCFCLYAMARTQTKWLRAGAKVGLPTEAVGKEGAIMKSLTFIQWYRILRAQHQWTVFRSMQYALWLMR